jgi:hypothetical protein
VAKIIPIYQRLVADNLLERCLQGRTQNECFHGLIWCKCPQEAHFSKRRVEQAASEAVCEHNTGYTKPFDDKVVGAGISPNRKRGAMARKKDKKHLLRHAQRYSKKY